MNVLTYIHNLWVMFFCVFFIFACSDNIDELSNHNPDPYKTGTIDVDVRIRTTSLNLPDTRAMAVNLHHCELVDIDQIIIQVYDESDVLLSVGGPWSCNCGHGIVDGIPVGKKRKIVVLCKNSRNQITYKGFRENVEVFPGKISRLGVIDTYFYIPSLISVPDGAAVSKDSLILKWNGIPGAAGYHIIVFESTNLVEPVIDDVTRATSYAPSELSDNTVYYWQVFAIDPIGNQGTGSDIWSVLVEPSNDPPDICTDGDLRRINCGEGECKRTVTKKCKDGVWSGGACVPGNPRDEICNDGLDNDCDGAVDKNDEDCWECKPGSTQKCETSLPGVCSVGTRTCGVNGVYGNCVQNIRAYKEDCDDGLDNDCDGAVDQRDNDCWECKPGTTEKCETNLPGVCSSGIWTCGTNGVYGECIQNISAYEEVCDGLDNDCNGKIDENPVIIPNIIGLEYKAAVTDIRAVDGLDLGTIVYQCSATVGANRVIGQKPESGTVICGSAVNLTLSNGPCVLRVDGGVNESGDGSSWKNAYKYIQEAIDASSENSEIWVRGYYYQLKETIEINTPVSLYGGFDGNESERRERDLINNEVIIDGYQKTRCFNVTADCTIDGFTISSGYVPEGSGGGINNNRGAKSLIIRNCIFNGNTATQGGGIFNYSASAKITDCTFLNNHGLSGGGIAVYGTPNLVVNNCMFSSNVADVDYGGGLYALESSFSIINSRFYDNQGSIGAGVSIYNSTGRIFNSIFWNNDAGYSVNDKGGAICSYSAKDGTSDTLIANCTITGNSALYGGGLYNYADIYGYTKVTVINSILWDNEGEVGIEIYNTNTIPVVQYSNVAVSEGFYKGDGNINADPLFIDQKNGDFHLNRKSPCIDAGDSDASHQEMDFEEDDRIIDGNNDSKAVIDMGADEFLSTSG